MNVSRELGIVARRLGPLRERVVFVGGMVRSLLVTDPAVAAARPTDDVDLIVDLPSRVDLAVFAEQLRRLGFREANEPDAPICRWIVDGVRVDVMPVDPAVLGFSNVWYPGALESTTSIPTEGGDVRVIDAPHFVATKLEAFGGRGSGDYYHHDIEDVIAVIDGRETLATELGNAPSAVRDFVASQAAGLLGRAAFLDALPGHLAPDQASQARERIVLERLRDIARLATGPGEEEPEPAAPLPKGTLSPTLARLDTSQWLPVRSSNIRAVRYDAAGSVLFVEFRNGTVYEYTNVPPTTYSGLLQAGSAGRYHHRWIRLRYPYRQIV